MKQLLVRGLLVWGICNLGWSHLAVAQIAAGGIGGGGGGIGMGFGEPSLHSPVVVILSKSGKTVFGYSDQTGDWEKISADFTVEYPYQPVMNSEMVCFRDNTKAFAFSRLTGRWDAVELIDPQGAAVPMVSAHVAVIANGNRTYAFSAKTGKWDTVKLGDKVSPVVDEFRISIEIETLIHIFSTEAGMWATIDTADD